MKTNISTYRTKNLLYNYFFVKIYIFKADLIKLHYESPSMNLMEHFLSKLNLEFIRIISQLASVFSLPLFKTHLFLTTYDNVSEELEMKMVDFFKN